MAITQYETHNWTDAELITASKLNEMDRAIAAINEGAISGNIGDSAIAFNTINGYLEIPQLYAYGGTDNLRTSIYTTTEGHWMGANRLVFREYNPLVNIYENYTLPSVTTSSGTPPTYDILTTKNTGTLTYSGASWDPNEKSVPDEIWTQLNSMEIPAGKYIIFGSVTFRTNMSGRRSIAIHTSSQDPSASAAISNFARATFAPANSYTTFPLCSYYTATGNTEIRISGWQSSGSALGAIGSLAAMRIT